MNEIKLTIHPFEMDSLKEAAKKVQEEAGEAFAEYVILQEQKDRSTASLGDEIADTIQAACNLAARYNIDLQAAMERCERRNRGRGRYEDEDAEPCGIRDGHDCNCGRDCANASAGMGVLREKSPEEMSAGELIETLKATNSFDCRKILSDDWCDGYDTCINCRKYLFDMLKAAHEREIEKVRVDTTCNIACNEIAEMKRQIADLTHERDGLRRRLEELSEAGITELHRLLRETVGEAKNITHNARVYINKKQESKDEHCGSSGSIGRNHGVDCGVERAGERVSSEEPPAQEMSEREAAIERLRELELTEENMSLYKIVCAVLGHEPATWWRKEDRAELCDKLIELLNNGE